MKKFLTKGAVAVALCAVVLLAGAAIAANTVTVRVLSGGNPVEGAAVQVIASDAGNSYITNQNGTITAELNGKFFRLKVNGDLLQGLHSVNENVVTVELN